MGGIHTGDEEPNVGRFPPVDRLRETFCNFPYSQVVLNLDFSFEFCLCVLAHEPRLYKLPSSKNGPLSNSRSLINLSDFTWYIIFMFQTMGQPLVIQSSI